MKKDLRQFRMEAGIGAQFPRNSGDAGLYSLGPEVNSFPAYKELGTLPSFCMLCEEESFASLDKEYILLDHGVNIKGQRSLVQQRGCISTAVAKEANHGGITGLIPELIPDKKTFPSYTERDFSFDEERDIYTFTSEGIFGEESTVYLEKIRSSGTLEAPLESCPHCGKSPVAYLTNACSGERVYICSKSFYDDGKNDENKRYTDFGLLVLNTLFPNKFHLFTEDSCLGWSSASLGSFSRNKTVNGKDGKIIFWKDYFKCLKRA